jgi:hypothetical protein
MLEFNPERVWGLKERYGVVVGGLDSFVVARMENGVAVAAELLRSYMPRSVFRESRTLEVTQVDLARRRCGVGQHEALGQRVGERTRWQQSRPALLACDLVNRMARRRSSILEDVGRAGHLLTRNGSGRDRAHCPGSHRANRQGRMLARPPR